MSLPKRYDPTSAEPALDAMWQEAGTYHFRENEQDMPLYAIDTPPPTASGRLHIGHLYSYSHTDFMARYFRMRGWNVYYPLGFDDNGLPTERVVEKRLKIRAAELGRQKFAEICYTAAGEMEAGYRALLHRLGLSVDWRYTYRTIDAHSQRCSQHAFIELFHKGLVYRASAPAIWCSECRTAIAQADLNDLERTSEYVTLPFRLDSGETLPIATTRPELLAACVAVFVHPDDARYQAYIGRQAEVPLYGQRVPVLADSAADPAKGSGAVMCCTFGDQADVAWWYTHKLPLVEAIDAAGRMTAAAALDGEIAGLPVDAARARIKEILVERGLILDRQPTSGAIRVHERCDTPAEYLVTKQWFVRVLENKEKFLQLGEQLRWHPESMLARYRAWVENLNWDWCISRQRYYGVPFPAWHCKGCDAVSVADLDELPVDPLARGPSRPCACGSAEFEPDTDIMDTWATSSVSPMIASGWLEDPRRFEQLFPMTLRPHAHEIIRTWTFYSIVKSWYQFGRLPWQEVLISGWAVAGEGMAKISKSRGGGPMAPDELLRRYSADAVRYWSATAATGRDLVISEEKMQGGVRLITKLWNVARFAEPFLGDAKSEDPVQETPADRWILARLDVLVKRVTAAFDTYEYAQARAEIENFFWRDLADNYIEMAKLRLYDRQAPAHAGACRAIQRSLRVLLQLLAPLLPFVTETLWGALFAEEQGTASIHNTRWPEAAAEIAPADLAFGEQLIEIATAVRRYKSEHALSLGAEIACLHIAADGDLGETLQAAAADLRSVTRAREIARESQIGNGAVPLHLDGSKIQIGITVV